MATQKRMLTEAEARAEGYVVDHTCHPWFAYKGPRFAPTEYQYVLTDTEARLVEALRQCQWHQQTNSEGAWSVCPVCGQDANIGHTPECDVRIAFEAAGVAS